VSFLKQNNEIFLDIDRERIKTVLSEAYTRSGELLEVVFDIPLAAFLSKIDPYLDSNRISIPVLLDLPSKKFPDLKIGVDLRKKNAFAKTRRKEIQALLNTYLKSL